MLCITIALRNDGLRGTMDFVAWCAPRNDVKPEGRYSWEERSGEGRWDINVVIRGGLGRCSMREAVLVTKASRLWRGDVGN